MKLIFSLLAKHTPKTFKVSYSPDYTTFIIHHILSDSQHPLYELRKREYEKRKNEGLWWHVTTFLDLSKSGVVRSWCRRRLRNAFTEELKARGFNEHGKLVKKEALKGLQDRLGELPKNEEGLSLKGSVRLQVLPALISAKYADVRQETGKLVDILLEGMTVEALNGSSTPVARVRKFTRSQWNSSPAKGTPRPSRNQSRKKPKAATHALRRAAS
ncbi:hypothetical protein BU26DRAFT_513978 [Trematosphaeria pertusa]|uniref:Uncharacterized protein n=1 Tax=Trematosphaeria pertusa TaxID=390896 RepID=A0A6A6J3Q6_9PLEO|nr:uncharacterized protein BU26DRAFT_513978 [Trematosphaeria pertusa]KAF2257276.1 hypothetical protein BU26DRAFT_513978 [Trematosphaeria pertusa]